MPVRKKGDERSNDLLTTSEVCQRLKISQSKFYQLVKIYPLKYVGFGSMKRYDPDDIDAWIEHWKRPTPIRPDVEIEGGNE
jgi:excisionase family DNA binding protein